MGDRGIAKQRPGVWNIKILYPTFLAIILFSLTACTPPKPDLPPPPPAPDYTDLVTRYNHNIAGFTQLWSKGTMIIRGHKKDGKGKDDVETTFIIQLKNGTGPINPSIFLSGEKLGVDIFQAGSNDTYYWFFDIEQNDTLYFGRHEFLNPKSAEKYPLPIHPRQLPQLLGLLPIDPDNIPPEPAVESYSQGFLIEPPGTNTRLLLDHHTALPKRIDLIDETGDRQIICLLDQYETLKTGDGQHNPLVPTRITIRLVDSPAQMHLQLNRLTTSRIKPVQFDFEKLQKVYKPQTIINLDAD